MESCGNAQQPAVIERSDGASINITIPLHEKFLGLANGRVASL